MFAKIVKNEMTDLSSVNGGKGWILVPEDVEDLVKIYDKKTKSIRAMTDDEKAADYAVVVLEDAWSHLRNTREVHLYETDALVTADRDPIEHMPEYRDYLRDLPASYNDKTIMKQSAVMTFDEYVASL
tara:strand:- start:1501 stop:1884 length:384 start_codon:yes stop_codon:yes gene_type:complete